MTVRSLDCAALATALQARYSAVWPSLLALRERWMRAHNVRVAWPMLVGPTRAYATAQWRILIVGRETMDWGEGDPEVPIETIRRAMDLYAEFLDQPYRGAWRRTLQRLHEGFNPESPTLSVLSTNLFRMDEAGGMPGAAFRAELAEVPGLRSLVVDEIAILRPHLIIFAAGKEAESERRAQFASVPVPGAWSADGVDRIDAASLAPFVFRLPHPSWLNRKAGRLDDVLGRVITAVRGEAVVGRASAHAAAWRSAGPSESLKG